MNRRFALKSIAALAISSLVAGCATIMDDGSDIVDIAVSKEQFSTLVAALQAADLVDTLRSDGPFTVFAPTNSAFGKLPAGTVENLLKPENRDQLRAILSYHVVPGRVISSDLAGKRVSVATVEGSNVRVDGTAGVKVDGANVVVADIVATNGIVHVIDNVLLP